jgi:alpha-ribazole phosphatase
MTIYLIRHTKPDIPDGKCYGQSDIEVKEAEFKLTVSRIHQKIDLENVDKIYTSPLKRCSLLAHALMAKQSKIVTDERIKELDFGNWELQKWEDIDSGELERWAKNFVHEQVPEGESHMDLYNRISEFWDEIPEEEAESLAVVTHGGVIKSLLSKILEIPLEKSFSIKVHYGELIAIRYFKNNHFELEFLTSMI